MAYDFRNFKNVNGYDYDENKTDTLYAEDLNAFKAAINDLDSRATTAATDITDLETFEATQPIILVGTITDPGDTDWHNITIPTGNHMVEVFIHGENTATTEGAGLLYLGDNTTGNSTFAYLHRNDNTLTSSVIARRDIALAIRNGYSRFSIESHCMAGVTKSVGRSHVGLVECLSEKTGWLNGGVLSYRFTARHASSYFKYLIKCYKAA